MKICFAMALAGGWLWSAQAKEITIEMPAEIATLKEGPKLEAAQANCLTCHSPDYLRVQPPMPRKFWEGIVKKMREKYGAPITEDAVPPLLDYLAATYGVPETK